MNLGYLNKALDKAGAHLICTLGFHDFNRRRICRKCKFVECKPKINKKKSNT